MKIVSSPDFCAHVTHSWTRPVSCEIVAVGERSQMPEIASRRRFPEVSPCRLAPKMEAKQFTASSSNFLRYCSIESTEEKPITGGFMTIMEISHPHCIVIIASLPSQFQILQWMLSFKDTSWWMRCFAVGRGKYLSKEAAPHTSNFIILLLSHQVRRPVNTQEDCTSLSLGCSMRIQQSLKLHFIQ